MIVWVVHVLMAAFNIITDSTKIPGPGAYSPDKVYVNKPAAPKFSLGIRHSEFVSPLIIEVRDY